MRRAFRLAVALPFLLAACGSGDMPTFSTDLAGFNVPDAGDDVVPVGSEVGEGEVPEAAGDVPLAQDPGPFEVLTPIDVAPEPGQPDATTGDVTPIDDGNPGPEADIVAPDCLPGQVGSVACGLNGAGARTQGCAEGTWVDQGPCVDPDKCVNGNTQTHACGMNGRGTQVDGCTGGQLQPGACQDTDVCKDGDSQPVACPGGGGATKAQSCLTGQWTTVGTCSQPGRWTCQNNTCTPQFGAAGCGDGNCEPLKGESKTSCPADCDHGGTPGQGQPCSNALDCAGYDWPAGVIGYWECAGWLFGKTCNARKDKTFCGTPNQDYCYLDTLYLETPESCPSDCPAKSMNCGSAMECIQQDWPVQ